MAAAQTSPEVPFEGPRFQGGWRMYWMTDWHDEGMVHALDVTVFPIQGAFRLAGAVEVGLREDAQQDDLVLRLYATAGWQRPGRVTPFVVGTLGFGTIAQSRFGITDWLVLGSFGIDGGADVRIGTSFRLGGSLGLMRTLARGSRYDSITLRFTLGF
jgi:hypothetical protein